MSCKTCTSDVVLPTIVEDQAVISGVQAVCSPCDDGVCSTGSEGSVLTTSELDSCCSNSGVTILARMGSRRARFTGSGFIRLVKGVADVVPNVPMSLVTLWHEFFKPSPTSRPILGNPLPFPYLAVGSSTGEPHGIKGIDDEDCESIWNSTTKLWNITPTSESPKCQKGLLPRDTELEIVGYSAIAANGETDDVRCMATLQGTGIPIARSVATIDSECNCPGCDPSPSFASVVSFLAPPEENGDYVLRAVVVSGVPTYSWISRV